MSAAFLPTQVEQPRGFVGGLTNMDRVVAFLSANRGNGFCDSCIGLAAGVESSHQVNQVARSLSLTEEYVLQFSDCKRCGRTREVTAMISRT